MPTMTSMPIESLDCPAFSSGCVCSTVPCVRAGGNKGGTGQEEGWGGRVGEGQKWRMGQIYIMRIGAINWAQDTVISR